jgi:hypothetical protein
MQMRKYPDYEISTNGEIWSRKKQHLFQPSETMDYLHVKLVNANKKTKAISIHRQVAKHFIPNPNNYPNVNHKNGNKHDNRAENLEWVTSRQNRIHAIEVLGAPINGKRKVSYFDIKTKEKLGEFESLSDAAKKFNISYTMISRAASGVRKTAAGFNWEYNDSKKQKK